MIDSREAAMYPKHLVDNYWDEVCELLRSKHNLSEQQARAGIVGYRTLMESHDAEDVIYNQHTYQVADIVAGLLQQDYFRKPEVVESIAAPSSPRKPRVEARRKKQA